MRNILHKFWFQLYIVFCTVHCTHAVVNLAFHKTAKQSSTAEQYLPSRAVDGNLTQISYHCAHTNYNPKATEAWWQVDLQMLSEIKNVTIYYRNNTIGTRRLNGFKMYLHASSNRWRGSVPCYEDTEPGNPPSILTVNCSGNYRYVTIYNDKYKPVDSQYGPILELCEVQVYGCPNFTYGEQCRNSCSLNCVSSRCDVDNGYCLKGCKKDHFGHDCTYECNCLVAGCNRTNGACYKTGCKVGWQGVSCNKSCENNTFGGDCNATCYCLNGTCDRFSGECHQPGCQPGYIHQNCSTACKNNTFGFNCNTTCHCKSGGCNNVNGACNIPGCKDGWKGASCDKPCDRDKFGEACGKVCHCLNGTCDPVSGICFNEGCDPGWIDETCSVACQGNSFGNNCSSRCNCRQGGCNNVNGKCDEPGCKDGFKGDTCSKECEYGTFGSDCKMKCHCLNITCDRKNGSCYGHVCEQGYEGRSCNQTVVQKPLSGTGGSNQNQTTGIIVGLLVALIVVALIVAVFIFRNRRSKPKDTRELNLANIGTTQNNLVSSSIRNSVKKPPVDAIYSTVKHQPLMEDIYANFTEDDKPATLIKVKDLKYILDKESASDDLENEYKKIPFGQLYPCSIGELKKNKEKNRFRNLFPYDHSRVILNVINDDPDSEYINANYIDSVNERSAYIATQGPRPNTVDDFWRMVWQEKCGKIVMLTGIVEKGKVKCHQYWPDISTVLDVGDFELTPVSESDRLCYTQRQFSFTQKESGEVRTVIQFHFTAWPDHGTPDPTQLVLFHRKYMETESELNGPTIVHCSAGVGRTGTFIALDALFNYGKIHGEIDIREYVKIMREKRMNMIQTKDQYITVYEALYESFQFQDTSLSMDEFVRATGNIEIRIKDEFKKLGDNIPKYGESAYKGAAQNKSKNRNQEILPVEKFRPHVRPHDSSTSTYINAVKISSFRESVAFLVTQCPMPNTVADFWCMVHDYQSTTIVTLDCISGCEQNMEWIPRNSNEIQFGNFKLRQTVEPTQIYDTEETELSLIYEGNERKIKVFDLLNWNAASFIPSSKKSLIELIELVGNWKSARGKGPITVVCMDGAKCCGMFCAIYNILQKLRYEDSVDIFQTVKQLQIRRPEFFSSLEQYQFLYRMVQEHVETANVYAN